MPQTMLTGSLPGAALGELGVGYRFKDFSLRSFRTLSADAQYGDREVVVPTSDGYAAYRLRKQAETQKMIYMVSAIVLLVVVVVLVWLLLKNSAGKKQRPGINASLGLGGGLPYGKAPAPRAPVENYDMKDVEIDRKDKEIERKEMEIERKEKELEKERERRQKISSKYEAERRNFERELGGTKDELQKLREDREKLRKELEALQSQHAAEMRLTREQYDAKAAAVRKRFEEQLSEFETSQKHFWPEVFQEARSLSEFCDCVKESFADGSKTAAALYAELVSLGSRLGDMQAFVNQISPVGKALYAWMYDTGRTGAGFDTLLAQWLTEKVSAVDLKVVAVKPGEAYNNSIHDCGSLNGNSVSRVLSFLILGKSNRTELKAIVEVG